LQVGSEGPLRVAGVVEAIVGSVQRNFGQAIHCAVTGSGRDRWALPEAEAIPIALTLNELLTNAVKHSVRGAAPADIACELSGDEGGVRVTISNPARLAPGFDLARIPGGVSGLGLVRALLPGRARRRDYGLAPAGRDVDRALNEGSLVGHNRSWGAIRSHPGN
jgi:two-component sensor histidine kinase